MSAGSCGFLPIVEQRGRRLADVLSARLVLPDRARMRAAAGRGERRSRLRHGLLLASPRRTACTVGPGGSKPLPPARFERTTPGLGILCSIHLSYGGKRNESAT